MGIYPCELIFVEKVALENGGYSVGLHSRLTYIWILRYITLFTPKSQNIMTGDKFPLYSCWEDYKPPCIISGHL